MEYPHEMYRIVQNKDLFQKFEKLFGDKQLGMLMTKLYAIAHSRNNDLRYFLADKIRKPNRFAIAYIGEDKRKFFIKDEGEMEVDCVIWTIEDRMFIKIVEECPGTKELAEEIRKLVVIRNHFKKGSVSIHFCNFYATKNEEIEKQSYGLLEKGMAMTGRELCGRLGLDFDEVIKERRRDQKETLNYLINELTKIPIVKEKLSKDRIVN